MFLFANASGSIESTDGSGMIRQIDGSEAGERTCDKDTLPLRETGGIAGSKTY